VTDIVTLLMDHEIRKDLKSQCRGLGLTWHHIPLSGRRLTKPGDVESVRRVREIVTALRNGASVVVHCAAGLHQTGVFLYLIFRATGHQPTEALALTRQARTLTGKELEKQTRKSGVLLDLAERLYQKHLAESD
jgi:protein tyrosine phosphatase (PTP) superfamily phosphohydrolase (DUF442 family)